jgi:hypothetical protein
MRKTIALLFVASIFILTGCSTVSGGWEYKVVTPPPFQATTNRSGDTNSSTTTKWLEERRETERQGRENVQRFLNELGKDGWILISEDQGTFYLKRQLR